jgi:DNA-binding NarL/FixJ family response regulator
VVSILIADDSAEWRNRTRKILSTRSEWEIIAEACNGQEAVQFAADLRPDIVLLDIGMPVLNGIEAAVIIRQACPESRIIFVTMHNDEDITSAALEIGAVGYVLKTEAQSELALVIEAALQRQP